VGEKRGPGHNHDLDEAYATDTHRWWHLSRPPPELLEAAADGWLVTGARILDVGCGLGTEAAALAAMGSPTVGIDLSLEALRRAQAAHTQPWFVRADATRLPFADGTFDAAIDRGCFHYLSRDGRGRYGRELRRVVRPGGRMLLRASLHSAGARNDVDEGGVREAFSDWRIERMRRTDIPSDTRSLHVLLVRLELPPDHSAGAGSS